MLLSAIVLTKNEEANIPRSLRSLSFADEIIVVDDHSTDETIKIAKEHNATVLTRDLKNDFAAQRNYAMKQVKGEWILFVDADEEVTTELQLEIQETINLSPQNKVYYIKRRDIFLNQPLKHGEVSTAYNRGFIRLVKAHSGEWQGSVHETFVTKGSVGQLEHHLNHYPHKSVSAFIKEINRYSTLRAQELHRNGVQTSVVQIISFPLGKFLYTYFLKFGFLDGAVGFIYSFLMSFHSFLVRAKLFTYHMK